MTKLTNIQVNKTEGHRYAVGDGGEKHRRLGERVQ